MLTAMLRGRAPPRSLVEPGNRPFTATLAYRHPAAVDDVAPASGPLAHADGLRPRRGLVHPLAEPGGVIGQFAHPVPSTPAEAVHAPEAAPRVHAYHDHHEDSERHQGEIEDQPHEDPP